MDINIDKSRELLNKTLTISMVMLVLTSLLLFGYFKFGESKFKTSKKYYKVYATEQPKIVRLKPQDKPLTNPDSVEAWLRVGFLDLFKTTSLTYRTKERWSMFKDYFHPSIAKTMWNLDLIRMKNNYISQGYEIINPAIRREPRLLGVAIDGNGNQMWKYFFEVAIESFSGNKTNSKKEVLNIIVVVKEMNNSDNYKGIGIVDIKIK
tara:strand:- start:31170 stop:31790 length:621 start_codon:yes stop_codon:yes gene_type:complete